MRHNEQARQATDEGRGEKGESDGGADRNAGVGSTSSRAVNSDQYPTVRGAEVPVAIWMLEAQAHMPLNRDWYPMRY